MPVATGSTATATRPAARATSLLTAEAMPLCSAGTAASTVEVSGATVMARPSPRTATAGRTSVTYPAEAPIRAERARPAATTRGPTYLLVRPRGWHLPEKHFWVDGAPVSGSGRG